jgi:hypothetical protein
LRPTFAAGGLRSQKRLTATWNEVQVMRAKRVRAAEVRWKPHAHAHALQMQCNPKPNIDDVAEDARARASPGCTITPEAFSLCDDLMKIQHLETDDPRCIATTYAVQAWLTKGWRADIIRSTVDIVMSKRKEAPNALRYFEKAIAAAHAEHERPLPVATIEEGETNVIRQNWRAAPPRRKTMVDAFDEIRSELATKRGGRSSD